MHDVPIVNRQRDDLVSRELIDGILMYLEGEGGEEVGDAARELLDHFLDATTNWLGSPDYQRIIQKRGFSLAIKAPYVLHAMLAISARHLSHLKPCEKHNIVAAIHYQRALRTYFAQLGAPINSDNVDEIIGCGFLHTMLAFENISRFPEDERISTSREDAAASATWLRAMQGMGILQETRDIRSRSKDSIWLPVFHASGGCEDIRCQHAGEAADTEVTAISRSLHALCDVPLDSSGLGHVYHHPLELLCGLIRVDASHESVGRFIVFIGQLSPMFVQLFEQGDVKATLLMAYWCALMIGIDQWWIVNSAISECRRLCAILDRVSVSPIRELLHFPAQKCNYVLREINVGV